MPLRRVSDATDPDAAILLRSLLEQSVAGIYILDLDGTIRYINGRFAELCGYAPAAMIGRPFWDFVVDEEVAERRAAFARIAAGEATPPQMAGWFKRGTGERLALLNQGAVAQHEGRPAIVGVATDVTDRHEAARALARANHALRTLGEASAAFVGAGNESELLQRMCDFALATGGYSLAWVGCAEADGSVRPLARAGHSQVLDRFTVRWDDSERAQGPTGRAIRTRSVAIVRAGDPSLVPWNVQQSFDRAVIAIPLIENGNAFGSLTLGSDDPDAFGPDEVGVLAQLANNICYGIASLRNREALRASETRSRAHAARLETLWHIATSPALSGDERTLAMLAETTAAIRPGFPYMGALFRIHGEDVVVEAVSHTAEYGAKGEHTADLRAGLRVGIAGTAVEGVLELGTGTHAWDDLRAAFDTRACKAPVGAPRSRRPSNPAARRISCGLPRPSGRAIGNRRTTRTSKSRRHSFRAKRRCAGSSINSTTIKRTTC
jgi:PAS domain S-box-containing protein